MTSEISTPEPPRGSTATGPNLREQFAGWWRCISMQQAHVNGIKIAFETHGRGPPLVLIMGYRLNSRCVCRKPKSERSGDEVRPSWHANL
jgi:hypothetical protein